LHAQTKTDSLLKAAEVAPEAEKPKLYSNIAWSFFGKDYSKFYLYAGKAYQIASKLNNHFYRALTLRQIGIYYDVNGQPKDAIKLIDSALVINKRIKDQGGIIACVSSLGIIYYNQSQYEKALSYYQETLQYYEQKQDYANMANFAGNIGGIYRDLEEQAKAKEYYLKASEYADRSGKLKTIGITYNNLGAQYLLENNFAESERCLLKSLKAKEELGEPQSLSYTLQSLSELYLKQKKYQEAKDITQKSLDLTKKTGDKKAQILCLMELGKIELKTGDSLSADKNFQSAYDLSVETNNLYYQAEAAQGLSGTKKLLANYSAALNYHYVYTDIHDSLFRIDKFNAVNEMQTRYETEKKEREIVILNKERLLKDAQLMRSNAERLAKVRELEFANQEKQLNGILLEKTQTENTAKEKENQVLKMDRQVKNAELAKSQAEKKQADELSKRRTQQLYGALIGAILVVLLLALIYRSYREKKKANFNLTQKNELIQQQKQEVEHQKEIVEVKNKEITDSITYAKRLQDAILPPIDFIKQHLPQSFVFYKPKDIVAGDFYWMEVMADAGGEETILLAAADCTGHGVPGAMVSVVCSNALNRSVKEFNLRKPGEILDKTRELVLETFAKSDADVKDGMDISLVAIKKSAQPDNVKLQWAGANNPLWYVKDDQLHEIKAHKQPIGKADNLLPFSTHELSLHKGDFLYLFTDGYADQFGGPKGKKFKYKQLEEFLFSLYRLPVQQQENTLQQKFENWRGTLDQIDDVCIIGIRI
jgi:serine phosphatase RsbU (regulator of sigma subunit)/tetratricopeptide (TPR) repeat protein/sporulation protein YlmC with PRC-barrel domain